MRFDAHRFWNSLMAPFVETFNEAIASLRSPYDPYSDPSLTREEADNYELERLQKEEDERAAELLAIFDEVMVRIYETNPEFRKEIAIISSAAGRLDAEDLEAVRLVKEAYERHKPRGIWPKSRDNK